MSYNLSINSLAKEFKKIKNLKVEKNIKLADYCSFKVGGPADLFLSPQNTASLAEAIHYIYQNQLPYFILGKGSNLIIADKGYRGIIIYTGLLNNYSIKDNIIKTETGIELAKIAAAACRHSLSGFEFAAGIPGSVGGALYMNAGAYGGEMKDVILSAKIITENGSLKKLSKKELDLSYRNSILQQKEIKITAAEITLKLKKSEKKMIIKKIKKLQQKRWSKQPLELPSAGSIFKRPANHYPGALIEKAGLKGYRLGGAEVSAKHAGFIVNQGQAKAADIINLIEKVKKEVYKISGVQLEVEPRFLGEF